MRLAQPDIGEDDVDVEILHIDRQEHRRRDRRGLDIGGGDRLQRLAGTGHVDDVQLAAFLLVIFEPRVLAHGEEDELRVDDAGGIAEPDDRQGLAVRNVRRHHQADGGRAHEGVEMTTINHAVAP